VKYVKKLIFSILLFFYLGDGYSVLRLNVETILTNHIDDGLVLSSEFNFSEFVYLDKEFVKKINEKFEIRLRATFFDDLLVFGPTDIVKVDCSILFTDNRLTQKFQLPILQINLGQKKAVNVEIGSGRWLEVLILPEMESYYVP